VDVLGEAVVEAARGLAGLPSLAPQDAELPVPEPLAQVNDVLEKVCKLHGL
jgi:hypothetical protein